MMMGPKVLFVLTSLLVFTYSQESILDDSILHNIRWNEHPFSGDESNLGLHIVTKNEEKYFCLTDPSVFEDTINSEDESAQNALLSPYDLIKPLFSSGSRKNCIHKNDHYWTYELCHGRHIRQYHEDQDSLKSGKYAAEFILGSYDPDSLKETEGKFNELLQRREHDGLAKPTITIEGKRMPFIEFNYTDGTLCDLNNKARSTRVRYVCSDGFMNDFHSLKETTTCEYEAIIFTPVLCINKEYKLKTTIERDIQCYPQNEGDTSKPKIVTEFDSTVRAEDSLSKLFEGKTIVIDTSHSSSGMVHVHLKAIDSKTGLDTTLDDLDLGQESKGIQLDLEDGEHGGAPIPPTHQSLTPNPDIVRDFLSGELCLTGGTGWWKFEFCYGKSITQYHEEGHERVQTIVLGVWDEEKHQERLKRNPNKQPPKDKTPIKVSHFYSDGEVCESTGVNRRVEVKLMCKYVKGGRGSAESVTLYLREPATCDYILGIESPFFCKLLDNIDENGLIRYAPPTSNFLPSDLKNDMKEDEDSDEDIDDSLLKDEL